MAKVILSVKEALGWLRLVRKLTDERRYYTVSVWAEDIEELLTAKVRPTPAALERLCQRYCPSGRRGHMTMVLRDPYDARALACLVGIVRAINVSELSEFEPEPVLIQEAIPEPKKTRGRKPEVKPRPAPIVPVVVAPTPEPLPTSDVSALEESGSSGEELARRALLGELD